MWKEKNKGGQSTNQIRSKELNWSKKKYSLLSINRTTNEIVKLPKFNNTSYRTLHK